MPKNRPGKFNYVVNNTGGVLTHGQPVAIGQSVGIAVKQKPRRWSDGLAVQAQIDINEAFGIIAKGIVEVTGTFARDSKVYITSGNVLTNTATSNTAFGVVVEVPGDGRGVPTGKVRIDLDKKDQI